MSLCSCGSGKYFHVCCGPYLNEQQLPSTPEQLMRSRYTAYTQAHIEYINKTMKGQALTHFNAEEASQWAKSVSWLGLKVIESHLERCDLGFVEFIATFIARNQLKTIHERSEFHHYHGQWFYVNGINLNSTKRTSHASIARNTMCPCDSGKKFKNCHER